MEQVWYSFSEQWRKPPWIIHTKVLSNIITVVVVVLLIIINIISFQWSGQSFPLRSSRKKKLLFLPTELLLDINRSTLSCLTIENPSNFYTPTSWNQTFLGSQLHYGNDCSLLHSTPFWLLRLEWCHPCLVSLVRHILRPFQKALWL